jgi:endonuclease/exonuclease/phosphatase family metal-dependent hydrolase
MLKKILLGLLFSAHIYALEINILSYNVENLFDPSFIIEKKDWTFTPTNHPDKRKHCLAKDYGVKNCLETNWTEEKLNAKLHNIASVIKSYNDTLDLIALTEIEDQHVVDRLAKLLDNHQYVITDSPDVRGVNVALMYKNSERFKFVKYSELDLGMPKRPSRNILMAEFVVDSIPLIVFVNHWPSQMHPATDRVKAAKLIKTAIDRQIEFDPRSNILLLGDFNTIEADRPDPFDVFLRSETNQLYDIDSFYRNSRQISANDKNRQPLASYFYAKDMRWTLLDHIFVNKNLLNHVNLKSYEIVAPDFAKSSYIFDSIAPYKIYENDARYGTVITNVPIRSDFKAESSAVGYSDHFPVGVQFVW